MERGNKMEKVKKLNIHSCHPLLPVSNAVPPISLLWVSKLSSSSLLLLLSLSTPPRLTMIRSIELSKCASLLQYSFYNFIRCSQSCPQLSLLILWNIFSRRHCLLVNGILSFCGQCCILLLVYLDIGMLFIFTLWYSTLSITASLSAGIFHASFIFTHLS
jgi:hypothetical protein